MAVRSVIVSEAAAKVSAERRAALPGIPWPAIVGMRNRLAHVYFHADEDIPATASVPASHSRAL